MAETKLSLDTRPWDLGGNGVIKTDETILQDAGRATVLAFLTVMAKKQSDGKLIPLTDINPALTNAFLTCGTNGGNLAAWQAVGDGAFKISVDGTLLDITGLVFTAVAALTDISEIINEALAGRATCVYDQVGNNFLFHSNRTGLPASVVTYLTAGSAGTDISGAGFLNGLTGTGVITAATGEITASIPAGLLMNDDILAATLVAGDVTDKHLLIGGGKYIDEDMIILENSLTLASIIAATGFTIRKHLEDLGILPRKSRNSQQIQPIN